MSNPVVIDAIPGTSYVDITREFDAAADNVDAAFFQVLDHRRKISVQEWLTDTLPDRAAQVRQLRDELLEFV